MQIVSRTHPGLTGRVNQDRLLIRHLGQEAVVLLVADGLGGHPAGEVAAAVVAESVDGEADQTLAEDLKAVLLKANDAVIRHGITHPETSGMGSTALLTLVNGDDIRWAHIGDSRLYHLHDGELRCTTRDQTLARQLYDRGDIDFTEIRGHRLNHFLEQCLGEDDVLPDSGSFSWHADDTVMLSSDGLHDVLDDRRIQACLAGPGDLEKKADLLLEGALSAGGPDNISLILCRR